jgi:predicted peptidase
MRLFLGCILLTILGGITSGIQGAVVTHDLEGLWFNNSETGQQLPCRFSKPFDYDPNKSYPIVVYLHGSGESGFDNAHQVNNYMGPIVDYLKTPEHAAFFLVPQAPYYWDDGTTDMIFEVIDFLMEDYNIDLDRLYLTGFSMGGSATWRLLSQKPDKIAAAVPIAGHGYPSTAPLMTEVPIWAFHAADDGADSPYATGEMIDAVRAAGGDPLYTRYESGGHLICGKVFSTPELYDWMFAQSIPEPSSFLMILLGLAIYLGRKKFHAIKSFVLLTFIIIFGFTNNTQAAITVDEGIGRWFQNVETSDGLRSRLFMPTNYDPNQDYPLILFLHSEEEKGNDNCSQLNEKFYALKDNLEQNGRKAFIFAPQITTGWAQTTSDLRAPLETTLSAIDLLGEEFSIDPNRLYVTGISLGGIGVYDLVSKRPNSFAAAVPICGFGDTKYAAGLTNQPIWAFHASDDPKFAASKDKAMIDAIRSAGGNPLYTEYGTGGHDIWGTVFETPELYDWMFAQSVPEPSSIGLLIVGLGTILIGRKRFRKI